MLKTNKSISITGTSNVDVSENGNTVSKIVAYMNATIPENGDLNINKSIQNRELFDSNKDDVLADFAEFESYVYGFVN